MGHALSIVQQKTKPFGRWTKWLVTHDIPTVTAWDAIKALRKSANEEEVSKLTITEAKTKFGIYPEFRADEEEPSSSEPKGTNGEDVERQVNTLYRRLCRQQQKWSANCSGKGICFTQPKSMKSCNSVAEWSGK